MDSDHKWAQRFFWALMAIGFLYAFVYPAVYDRIVRPIGEPHPYRIDRILEIGLTEKPNYYHIKYLSKDGPRSSYIAISPEELVIDLPPSDTFYIEGTAHW